MSKTHVYFVPGLAASIEIFENIKLPKEQFKMHYLEWILPLHHETIENYAKRMCKGITHENCVLIGVSFGGIMVQEMSEIIKTQKVIIISSVKSNQELPIHMKLAKATKLSKAISEKNRDALKDRMAGIKELQKEVVFKFVGFNIKGSI